jgi:riboflavin kinase/FMN adenylyltransferase
LNIGNRPTFQRNERAIEVHLFDFSDNIYGRDVEILFRKRWRDEHKFENSTLLVEQLEKDEQEIRRYLQP